jgi:uncharacterized protein
MSTEVEHDPAANRFVMRIADDVAFLEYKIVEGATPAIWDFRHTFCPASMRGRGIAGKIVLAAFEHASCNDIKIIPTCTYIPVWLSRHPDYAHIVASPLL